MNDSSPRSFDPVWNEIYGKGELLNRAPWDTVVGFIFRHRPRNRPFNEINILEVGCGGGNNLLFAAKEGFRVAGIDASANAIAYAKERFQEENLQGNLVIGDFTQLPFPSNHFDLVFDHCALTCSGFSSTRKAIAEIRRVLKPQGRFLFNPYSDRHSCFASGRSEFDGLRTGISVGTLANVGQICFYARRDLDDLFQEGWRVLGLQHMELTETLEPHHLVHAEWRVIAETVK